MDMKALHRYVVTVEIMAYGESPADAVDYVESACGGLLDQDGIFGYSVDSESVDDYILGE
jgi:hypothetical protein